MNEIEVLIDQYRQRVKTAREMVDNLTACDRMQEPEKIRRLATKLSCYRTFITELEIIQQNYKPMTI